MKQNRKNDVLKDIIIRNLSTDDVLTSSGEFQFPGSGAGAVLGSLTIGGVRCYIIPLSIINECAGNALIQLVDDRGNTLVVDGIEQIQNPKEGGGWIQIEVRWEELDILPPNSDRQLNEFEELVVETCGDLLTVTIHDHWEEEG